MANAVRHRPLLAFRPPPLALGEIDRWRRFARCEAPLGPGLFHVTLLRFEDHPVRPDALIEVLTYVLSRAALPSACRLLFDQLVSGPGSSLLAPSEPLRGAKRFYADLAAALTAAGFTAPPPSRFSPHLTLGYRQRRRVSGPIDPISWTAGELFLIRSLVGAGRHVVEARWPLPNH